MCVSGAVWDWEFITQDHNYTAYRKHYKNTGLFQYKVIGHYDDITAKAFFEVQVRMCECVCQHCYGSCAFGLYTTSLAL